MGKFSSDGVRVGIVGATGAVGVELARCLANKQFPISRLHLYASERSAGKTVDTDWGPIEIEAFSVEACRANKFLFLPVSGAFALEHARSLSVDDGPYVIDNSSAFRYDADKPLCVPEINADTLLGHKLIANPNCTTAIAAVALWPIHTQYHIKRIIFSTYQAASGAGSEGVNELKNGTHAVLRGENPVSEVFSHQLAFNLIPHIDTFQSNG
jgi:aspartate-semialdehyde dehydrogenase